MMEWHIELIGAIIGQAIHDLTLPDSTEQNIRNRKSAETFLAGNGLEIYCKICGLEAAYIRKKVKKVALLTKAVSKIA